MRWLFSKSVWAVVLYCAPSSHAEEYAKKMKLHNHFISRFSASNFEALDVFNLPIACTHPRGSVPNAIEALIGTILSQNSLRKNSARTQLESSSNGPDPRNRFSSLPFIPLPLQSSALHPPSLPLAHLLSATGVTPNLLKHVNRISFGRYCLDEKKGENRPRVCSSMGERVVESARR